MFFSSKEICARVHRNSLALVDYADGTIPTD